MPTRMTRAALVAALYVAVTGLLAPISFGPVQFRLSEALVLLPLLWAESIPGLWVGCLIANWLFGGLGPIDIFGGSAITGLAAYLTWLLRARPWVAALPPILLNAVLVSAYLAYLLDVPYLFTVLTVGIGEAVVVLGPGMWLVTALRRLVGAGNR